MVGIYVKAGRIVEIYQHLHLMQKEAMEEPILQFFKYENLPEHLAQVSKPFGDLAAHIVETLPRNPERTVALRKLLESKDASLRAVIFKSGI